ncbi:hypothetical protein M406DRAFT_89291 [Cryphonectria parasitica EP155]|uniref:Nucleoporin NDC1 n=1 Tax=Cryphonectria parasitica (strain ATCC 38755 / EP155) TaxID=660469 RepID=A0A9P4Y4R5_CRYP1|nr:uncharacterized protein M406DRAFT_89291 [Cryphonectria parasitica EP155]KAF3766508.1 hypothetical protein M406DRAFT_89291 [Cryphonectria parasitica EP155]
MAPVRRAPYKDFLQASLQRRFSSTTTILLVIAYVESLLFAVCRSPRAIFSSWWSFFWLIFPIGPTGIRAFFIFLCGLTVVILRIAQYHVGIRTSNSGYQTFLKYAATSQTLEAIVSYTVSSLLFSQVYLWTSTANDLSWVVIQSGDRARLNEKPIFYTVHCLLFGLLQGILHIYRDDDRLLLRPVKLKEEQPAATNDKVAWQTRLSNDVPALASLAAMQSVAALVFSGILYHAAKLPDFMSGMTLRALAWRTALAFFRTFYTLPKTNMVPATLASVNAWMWLRCFSTGFMLLFMWLAGIKMFSMFLVRPPLKLGNPLTSESKDPNGSLLNGLKSKKLHIKSFAMWELALIARDFGPRRKAIYQDIDRKDGPAWSQVYALCHNIVKEMEARIDDCGKAPTPPSKELVPAANGPNAATERSLQVSNDPILLSTPTKKSKIENIIGKVAVRSPGQEPRLSPIVQKGYFQAKGVVQEVARQATSSDDLHSPIQKWTRQFLKSPFGKPFRNTLDQRLTVAVLGAPYAEPSLFINAISAVTKLALHSLAEDNYGNVQRDVSTIIRSFTALTVKLEKFRDDFPAHWTELDASRESPVVDAVLETLKEALRQLIESFGPYARDIRLTFADMRQARDAAGIPHRARETAAIEAARPPERRQVR